MRIIFTLAFISYYFTCTAQFAVNFDQLPLAPESYWDGSDGSSNHFVSENGLYFPTWYDTSFGGYWAGGFAYSNLTDSVSSGYGNQYACKAGSGQNNSQNYVVTVGNGWFRQEAQPGSGIQINEVSLCNSTYAYNSMRDGDAFAKKFGGIDGTDPDFFSVIFTGFWMGNQVGQPVEFFLADFRSNNSSEDYIIRDWTVVSLESLGYVDSIAYSFTSSDVGEFGINTPLYFCMDSLVYNPLVISIPETKELKTHVFPNPSSGEYFTVKLEESSFGEYFLRNSLGEIVRAGKLEAGTTQVNQSGLSTGVYQLEISSENQRTFTRHLIIQ